MHQQAPDRKSVSPFASGPSPLFSTSSESAWLEPWTQSELQVFQLCLSFYSEDPDILWASVSSPVKENCFPV